MKPAESPATLQDVLELIDSLDCVDNSSPCANVGKEEWLRRHDMSGAEKHEVLYGAAAYGGQFIKDIKTFPINAYIPTEHPTRESALTALYNQIEKKYGAKPQPTLRKTGDIE